MTHIELDPISSMILILTLHKSLHEEMREGDTGRGTGEERAEGEGMFFSQNDVKELMASKIYKMYVTEVKMELSYGLLSYQLLAQATQKH